MIQRSQICPLCKNGFTLSLQEVPGSRTLFVNVECPHCKGRIQYGIYRGGLFKTKLIIELIRAKEAQR